MKNPALISESVAGPHKRKAVTFLLHPRPADRRPPVPDAEKQKLRRVRVSDDEWEAWQRVAGGNVSAWLRELANKAAKRLLRRD